MEDDICKCEDSESIHKKIMAYGKTRAMNGPIVTTTEGKVQGAIVKSVYGPEYLAFTGIPYGAPPVGPLRFQAPQPASKWDGIRDASKQGPFPMHLSPLMRYPTVGGSEDCLTVNVHTNKIESGRKKPVIFIIFGGAFIGGTNHESVNRCDYLGIRDLVLVSVNHRQGPMGFLNLGHKVASGNQGIRDIILALKWTRRNAEAFGGDPENITVLGGSSGAMIAHLLTLIPAAKGLFHKAILQSGLSFMVKNLAKGNGFKNGFRIAHLLGMDSNDPVKVLEFLQSMPAEKLIEVEHDILNQRERVLLAMYPYLPVYDADFSDDPLIPKPLCELLQNDADIPIIIGNTNDEFLFNCSGNLDNDAYFKLYDTNLEDILRNTWELENSDKLSAFMKDIRNYYLKNEPISKENRWNFVRMFSDLVYVHWNRKMIDLRNQHARAPTYYFNFSYLGDQPTIYTHGQEPQPLKGVAHGDDIIYLFYCYYLRLKIGSEVYPQEGTRDRIISERLVRMWYNFAAYGDPTPQTDDTYLTTVWKPSSKENLFYLDIGNDLTLVDDNDSESRKIYEKIKDMYNI